jgi:hypothetical protein
VFEKHRMAPAFGQTVFIGVLLRPVDIKKIGARMFNQ